MLWVPSKNGLFFEWPHLHIATLLRTSTGCPSTRSMLMPPVAHEGKMEKNMCIIGSGTARAYINVGGKEITIALPQSGDYFEEYSLFTGDSRCASVSALTDMNLVIFQGEAFESFIEYNEDTEEMITQQSLNRKQSLDLMRSNLVMP